VIFVGAILGAITGAVAASVIAMGVISVGDDEIRLLDPPHHGRHRGVGDDHS
jgi:hypothetical protein